MRYGSLTELANIPGELAGYGPIIAEMARQIALEEVAGKWTFTITDDGTVVSTGTLSRRPTAAQRRQAYADYHLRLPGLPHGCIRLRSGPSATSR
jgi:hypothetical protein